MFNRIASAMVMIGVVCLCFYFGKIPTLFLVLISGVLVIDELFCNFLGQDRFTRNYLFAELFFILIFIYVNYVTFPSVILYFTLVLNLILIYYLFFVDIQSNSVVSHMRKKSFLVGPFVFLPLATFSSLFYFDKWPLFLGLLFIINFGMDSGAWFFGMNFGKRKLWPSVSPNKTIAGLWGGMLVSGLFGSL